MTRWSWVLLGALIGCSGEKTGTDTGTEGDTDTDTDTDSDTDTDTDTDTDSDTDTAASSVSGRWRGDCAPSFPTTPDTGFFYYLYDTIVGAELRLELTEAAGEVTGDGLLGFQILQTDGYVTGDTGELTHITTTTYTYSSAVPVVTQGSWDGTELVLVFALDLGYVPPDPLGAEFTGTLAGDTLTGLLAVYPIATSTFPMLPFDCTLERQ